jgi:hypothetical protein
MFYKLLQLFLTISFLLTSNVAKSQFTFGVDVINSTNFVGWACDKGNAGGGQSADIHIYALDSLNGSFWFLAGFTANGFREAAVGVACSSNSFHGFERTRDSFLANVPADKRGRNQNILAYVVGPSGNQLIAQSVWNSPLV